MTPSEKCIQLIKDSEGLKLHVYKDAVGIPTIGYGSTIDENGNKLMLSHPPITEQVASQWLLRDATIASKGLLPLLMHQITQGQFDALISWIYNLGIGNFKSSTLLRKLNAWDILGASQEFGRWVHAGNQILPGLVIRREKERVLFLS